MVHLKLAFVNIVVICNSLFYVHVLYVIQLLYIVCFYLLLFYLLHLLRIKVLDSLLQISPVFISVVIIANFCGLIFVRIIHDEYYLFSSDEPPAAANITNVNVGFKQFATAVGIYAAKNPQ